MELIFRVSEIHNFAGVFCSLGPALIIPWGKSTNIKTVHDALNGVGLCTL